MARRALSDVISCAVTAAISCLVIAHLAACSPSGVDLLRHEVPDVSTGELWTFGDLVREGQAQEVIGWEVQTDNHLENLKPGPSDDEWGDPEPPPPVRLVTDGETFSAMLDLIRDARERLYLVHLQFLEGALPDQIESALLAAAARGVSVRVLLEKDVDENAKRVASLQAGGSEARLDTSSRTLHVKMLVADGVRVLIGSTNLSTSSLKYNREANWLFTGSGLGEAFEYYASCLWASDEDLQVPPDPGEEGLRLIGDGQYRYVVEPLIEGATERVLVVMYQVNPDDHDAAGLLHDIIAARAREADARVLLEKSGFADYVNAMNEAARQMLLAGGVPVRFDSPEIVTHAKMVIADDWVVLYSGNWVGAGLRKNHEAGAAVRSLRLAGEAASWFESLWISASP